MKKITIYHNPKCGTSRNTLNLIKHLGLDPEVIYYLDTPPTEQELFSLLNSMNMKPFDLLRKNVPEYQRLQQPETMSEQDLVTAMVKDPILINRPIVVGDIATKLCRPSEVVLSILSKSLENDFVKEDGEVIKAK